jgi:hypothetical protein
MEYEHKFHISFNAIRRTMDSPSLVDIYQTIPLDDQVFPEQKQNPVDMEIIGSIWSAIASVSSKPN